MTFEERAASMSQRDIVALLVSHQEQKQQIEWFKRQLFGPRSDRRLLPENVRQLALGEQLETKEEVGSSPQTPVRAHHRRGPKQRLAGSPEESGLRFDPSVPVEVIEIPNPEITEENRENYRLIQVKTTHRLAQRPGSYVVLRYERKVFKEKTTGEFSCPRAPAAVLERSFADVSFLAGLLTEKGIYYLPLYRQHQRLAASGIKVSRSLLTYLCRRTIDLLLPIHTAQLLSILESAVLTMDETPIKAGRKGKGKMKTGYFWPVYGDQDEIAFPFSPSRAKAVVEAVLGEYCGVLQTDGYEVYARYAEKINGLVHAQCWSHTRRLFVQAEPSEPTLGGRALDLIGSLYEHEERIREQGLADATKQLYRAEHCKPVVDEFFFWLTRTMQEHLLLPSSPFTKAGSYALEREKALRVFLEYPNVAVDTNHLEREIRPIALGRKNWMFCWTELGAHHMGVLHSLLGTCRLQGVDPYTYLVDVLQRISSHPAKDVHLLTPRLWKKHFAANPMRSDLDLVRNRAPDG
jgi:transposase